MLNRSLWVWAFFIGCGVFALVGVGFANSESKFPPEVRTEAVNDDDEEEEGGRLLQRTGVSARRFAIFEIYAIAHYTNLPRGADLLAETKGDRLVRMRFARSISGRRVQREVIKAIRERVSVEVWQRIEPSVEAYCAPFANVQVQAGDCYQIHWMEAGILRSTFNDQPIDDLEDAVFARALWSIWVGENSLVDRDALLQDFCLKE